MYKEIPWKLVRGPDKDFKKASETLKDGYGICMNQARLMTALCRATGIPAGIITGFILDGSETYHHDWVEIYDESGRSWITLDPTLSDSMNLNTLNYFDLIYSPDNNSLFPFRYWLNAYSINKDGVSLFFPDRELHLQTGRFKIKVTDNKAPDYIELQIEYKLQLSSLKKLIPGR